MIRATRTRTKDSGHGVVSVCPSPTPSPRSLTLPIPSHPIHCFHAFPITHAIPIPTAIPPSAHPVSSLAPFNPPRVSSRFLPFPPFRRSTFPHHTSSPRNKPPVPLPLPARPIHPRLRRVTAHWSHLRSHRKPAPLRLDSFARRGRQRPLASRLYTPLLPLSSHALSSPSLHVPASS